MSFEEIYQAYYKKLYAFAWQYTLSKPDTEDLLHETFLRLWKETRREPEIENIQAWLYKVLLNLIYTQKTRERNHAGKLILMDPGNGFEKDWHEALFENERQKILICEINKLPDIERNLLILYHQELKYDEIARILNLNPASVGTMLARAIGKLKNNLRMNYHELFE